MFQKKSLDHNRGVEHQDARIKEEAEATLRHLAQIASGELVDFSMLIPKQLSGWLENPNGDQKAQYGMVDGMYRMLLEQLPVVTFMARLEGEFSEMYVSPQIEVMLGYSQREWLENPILWYECLHPEDKARWNIEFSQFLMLDEPFRSVYRFIARDGHEVWVRGEVKMVRNELGQPVYIQGIGYDITEIKQAEEANRVHDDLERRVEERTAMLAQTNVALQEEIAERQRHQQELERTELQLLHSAKLAALGTLATGVAHELNQPLSGIRAIAQQLLHEEGLPEYCADDLKLIEAQTQRMSKIINHLRSFARAPSQEVASVDINEVVHNCFILIGQQLKAHGVTVELALGSDLAKVRADANELEQVVLNLVTNARDALGGRPDARIVLRSRQEAERVVLEVCDNGPGVPEDYVSRIFDPFFTTKDIGKGTGLGLSISYNILTRFGGTLEYRSENGAVFTLNLPQAPF